MSDPKPLTRKELREFLPSQRAVRSFEKLFELIPSSLDENRILSLNGISKSNQALATGIENSIIVKSSRVLVWLSM